MYNYHTYKNALNVTQLTLLLISAISLNCSLPSPGDRKTIADIEADRIHLANGWGITPVGKHLSLGDLPLNLAVSPSGKLLAVTNNGHSDQSVQLVDTETQVVVDSLPVGAYFCQGHSMLLPL